MEEISYPLKNLNNEKEILKENWLPEGYSFVRFKTEEDNSCFLHGVLFDVSNKYRNSTSDEEKYELVEEFKDHLVEYLTYESEYTIEETGKKIYRNISKNIKTIFPESYNIFGAVFKLKKGDNLYPIFSQKTKEVFLPNSRIFTFNSIIDKNIRGRYNKFLYKNEILESTKKLENIDITQEEHKNICEESKINIDNFNIFKNNLQDPAKIIQDIKKPTCILDDFKINIYSELLKINIFILKGWSDNVSVEKIFEHSDSYPYAILFLTGPGPVGSEGSHSYGHFEAGAVIDEEDNIIHILHPEKNEDLIYILKNYKNTDNSLILNNNYAKYLEMKRNKISEEEFKKSKRNLDKIDLLPTKDALDKILEDSVEHNKDIKDILDHLDLK